MAKFNVPAKDGTDFEARPDATQNHEGGFAFSVDLKTELYLRAASTLVGEPKFYDPDAKGDSEIPGLIATVAAKDPEFVLKLAVYCRNELYLRSVPMMLLVEACRHASKAFVRRYTPSIVKRADELAEVVAYYAARNGDIGNHAKTGMLCNSLKRGLADAFYNFGAYHFAKYDRDGKVKISDVIRIVHPKPKDEKEAELFKQVRTRTVPPPDTWEVVISGWKEKGFADKKSAWQSVVGQLPVMAAIRNLRNLLDAGVDPAPVIRLLNDKDAVLRSKQFPYRFFSAYREIAGHTDKNTRKVLDALNAALDISVENTPKVKGTTFIATDHSGSMNTAVGGRSKVLMFEVGAVLSAIARGFSEDAICGNFGETFAAINLSARDSVLTNVEKIRAVDVGHSTNAHLAVDYLLENKIHVDRILIFSDMQCYDGSRSGGSLPKSVEKYRNTINHGVYVYSFDLAGHGTAQFPQTDKKAVLLSGWSDRVLQFIPRFEAGGAAVDEIDKITACTYARKLVRIETAPEADAAD